MINHTEYNRIRQTINIGHPARVLLQYFTGNQNSILLLIRERKGYNRNSDLRFRFIIIFIREAKWRNSMVEMSNLT